MPYCAVLECKNDSRTKNLTKGGISYHRFPKAPDIKEKWIDATGKQNWFPTKASTICSEHFKDQDFVIKKSGNKYIVDTAIPTLKILCFKTQNLSAAQSLETSSTPLALRKFLYASFGVEEGLMRKRNSEVLSSYITQKKTKIETNRADSKTDFSSATSSPRLKKLNSELRWKENKIRRQNLRIRRLQAQNHRMKSKVKKIEDRLEDLEEKFNIVIKNLTNLKNTNVKDVFLMIRRKKLTIFTDAKDTTTVLELKKMIEGILKVAPPSQMLFNKDSQLMEDEKTLAEYGLTSATAKAQSPAPIGLALRKENGEFEALDLTPYSSPPDLPDVMKSQETNGQEQMDQH